MSNRTAGLPERCYELPPELAVRAQAPVNLSSALWSCLPCSTDDATQAYGSVVHNWLFQRSPLNADVGPASS